MRRETRDGYYQWCCELWESMFWQESERYDIVKEEQAV
jgi:hypothetical protein